MTSEGSSTLGELMQKKSDLQFKIRTGLVFDVIFALLVIIGFNRLPIAATITLLVLVALITYFLLGHFGRLQNCRIQISNFDNAPRPHGHGIRFIG